jgi:hypothetical protein
MALDLVFYQLALVVLVWFFCMLVWVCPSGYGTAGHSPPVVKIVEPTSAQAGDIRPAPRLCIGRAVDSEQLFLRGWDLLELPMDAVSQRYHIVVMGADDDTCIQRHFVVQADKVPPISGYSP